MTVLQWLRRRWWKTRQAIASALDVYERLKDPTFWKTYYPEVQRKTKFQILGDLLWWAVRYREFNRGYFLRGLDRREAPEAVRMSERHFQKLRNQLNAKPMGGNDFYRGKYNYLCLTRDKLLFGQFLTSLNLPTPENLAVLSEDRIVWADGSGSSPLASLMERYSDFEGFCKPVDGVFGQSTFVMSAEAGQLTIGDRPASINDLADHLDGRYLLQRQIVQHPDMNTLYPLSVNTLRVVTVRGSNGTVEVLSTALKVGLHGKRTDNPASGGVAMAVDTSSGCAVGDGFFKPGKGLRVQRHPDTQVRFDGFRIPFFKEALALAVKAHGYLYGLHSIGWDLAFAADGPLLVEANDDWGMPIFLTERFRDRFRVLFEENVGE